MTSRTGAKLRRWCCRRRARAAPPGARASSSPCGRRSRTADAPRAGRCSSRSRWTLAMIDAAEIARTRASPPITVAPASPARAAGCRRPARCSAAGASPSTARRIASSVARRMLSRSISSTLASATLQQTAPWRRISRSSRSRSSGCSSFESFRPRIGPFSSRITAAATTGPASGPRPASSTPGHQPATSTIRRSLSARKKVLACIRRSSSQDRLDRIGGEPGGVAAQLAVHRLEAYPQRLAGGRIVEPGEGRGGDLFRAWRRAAAARARRSRAAGCWAGQTQGW